MEKEKYLLLAGGVGAAKFIQGMSKAVDPQQLRIIVNTGDDIELFGLKICPDLDIITYTLAGVIDKEKGWGFQEETYNCLSMLKQYYDFGWFNAGDKDLATHIFRTELMSKGFSKAQATREICEKLKVKSEMVPMCNEPFETYIKTGSNDIMHFEEYYIKHKCEPDIIDVIFKGEENATPVSGVLDWFDSSVRIIICPSNPIVSIGTILRVKGIKKALQDNREKVYAISPIIEGTTVKGPADKLLKALNYEVSCVGVARYYESLISHFILDTRDKDRKQEIEALSLKAYTLDTLMTNSEKKKRLAEQVLKLD